MVTRLCAQAIDEAVDLLAEFEITDKLAPVQGRFKAAQIPL
jgi:hypothetical protein